MQVWCIFGFQISGTFNAFPKIFSKGTKKTLKILHLYKSETTYETQRGGEKIKFFAHLLDFLLKLGPFWAPKSEYSNNMNGQNYQIELNDIVAKRT